jgi:hypothetical protein
MVSWLQRSHLHEGSQGAHLAFLSYHAMQSLQTI